MVTKLERIAKMEAELAALKAEVKREEEWQSPVFYPEEGDACEYIAGSDERSNPSHFTIDRSRGVPMRHKHPVFRPGTGQAFADAIQVMLELRACEGVKQHNRQGGYYIEACIDGISTELIDCDLENDPDCLSPVYSCHKHAQAAIDKVGKDRIIAAAKTLANWRE